MRLRKPLRMRKPQRAVDTIDTAQPSEAQWDATGPPGWSQIGTLPVCSVYRLSELRELYQFNQFESIDIERDRVILSPSTGKVTVTVVRHHLIG